MDYKYNDIIEYEDATWSDKFEEARQWAKANNTELVELIDKRETRTITEEYEEEVTSEEEVEIPEVSHYEEIINEKTGKKKKTKVIDEPAHTEKQLVSKIEKKTREVEKLFRYFQIKSNSEE